MIDEIQDGLERKFGMPVTREGPGRYIITTPNDATISVFESCGKWHALTKIDTDATGPAGWAMQNAPWGAGNSDTPADAVQGALDGMARAWEDAKAKFTKAAAVAVAFKRMILSAKASPEARALNLAGIRRYMDIDPWRARQACAPYEARAVVGGIAVGLRALVEKSATGYRASINATYSQNVSERPRDGLRYPRVKATRTNADPIVALHGAIVAVLAKMERESARGDRGKCLAEARDNLARLLPSGTAL